MDHPTTTYRNRGPFPVPGDWVIGRAESGFTEWLHFPDHGEGHALDADVQATFLPNFSAYHDALDCRAHLHDRGSGEWRMKVGTETVFDGAVDEPVVRAGDALDEFTRDEGGDVGSDAPETAESLGETTASTLEDFVAAGGGGG